MYREAMFFIKSNMRKFILFLLAAAIVDTAAAEKREHRATWMSGYISDWPTEHLTGKNAASQQNQCIMDLDSMRRNNLTTIYYHVRTMCDAMYDSKYEPWSSYIVGTRGTTPPFDPLAFLLENAHKRGIEVYAWFNPYRYIDSSDNKGWGNAGGDKNYENSHPDWLIEYPKGNGNFTILNPALPEVKQRIVDVIADLLSKYDVDGVVFDDYFYQNGLPMSYDAEQYSEYVAGGGMLSQADWRRENVNDMVRMVNTYIKANKPWVRFGIGPAGVACSSQDVADKYGVTPCPGSDWQYSGIYSDPLAWYSEGTIDFMSPQVYWIIGNSSADYAKITPWWYEVAKKFNRHCYVSQDISANFEDVHPAKKNLDEFVDEVELNRSSDKVGGTSGTVYFPWKIFRSGAKQVASRPVKTMKLSTYLRENVFQHKALSPAVTWIKSECPGTVTGVTRSGRTVSWESDMENVRYTVYAVPESEIGSFHKEEEYLQGISYTNSFEIMDVDPGYPGQGIADEDLDDYSYAVCVLDRYGNEYSAVFEGAEVTKAEKPMATYPADGEKAAPIFHFSWTGNAEVYEIAISDDPRMDNILVRKEVAGNYAVSSDIWEFDYGKSYYWTVTARGNNTLETVSDVSGFTVDAFRITAPADGQDDCTDTPVISWVDVENATYHLEVSLSSTFDRVVYSLDTENNSVTIPEYELQGGTSYYARVICSSGDAVLTSGTVEFTTMVIVPGIPVFTSPRTDGVALHSNQKIEVESEKGILSCNIAVSRNEDFVPRNSYNATLSDFTFVTSALGDIRIAGRPLTDGDTYYTRARFSYMDGEGGVEYTAWTEPVTFVYSAEAGIDGIKDDGIMLVGGDEPAIVAKMPGVEVHVYGMDGKLIISDVTGESGRVSLSGLDNGAYMIVVESDAGTKTFKFIR